MSNNTKNYIGRKFSLQAFKETCYSDEPIPGWAIRCDGAPVYIDECGNMRMDAVLPNEDGKMITGYACHEAWTVKEEQ